MKKILIILLAIAFNVFAQGEGDRIVNPTWKLSSGVLSPTVSTWTLTLPATTFSPSIVTPLIIGGADTISTLTYKTTTGVGKTGARHIFQVGNNGGTEAMTILNDGKVGIGTANPFTTTHISKSSSATETMPLFVENPNAEANTAVAIGFGAYGSDALAGKIVAIRNGNNDHDMVFYTNGGTLVERMRLDNTGNMGLGTTTPYAQYSQVGATPIWYATDSDVNLHRTSLAFATDTSAIKIDASVTQPAITVKNTTGNGFTLQSVAAGGASFDGALTAVGTLTMPTPFTLGATSVTTTGTKLNYLTSATGTTGTASTNLVFSTSPVLVTPTLGAATGTTLTLANQSAIQATIANDYARIYPYDDGSNVKVMALLDDAGAETTTQIATANMWGEPSGGAILNGTTQYYSHVDNASLNFGTGDFSIEWYGKPANFVNVGSGYNTLIGKGVVGATGFGLHYLTDNKISWLVSTGSVVATSATYITNNKFIHFVGTRSGQVANLYADGILIATSTSAGNALTVNNAVVLQTPGNEGNANRVTACTNVFVKTHNKALTQAEVTKRWNNGQPHLYVEPYATKNANNTMVATYDSSAVHDSTITLTTRKDYYWTKGSADSISVGTTKYTASTKISYVSGTVRAKGDLTGSTLKLAGSTFSIANTDWGASGAVCTIGGTKSIANSTAYPIAVSGKYDARKTIAANYEFTNTAKVGSILKYVKITNTIADIDTVSLGTTGGGFEVLNAQIVGASSTVIANVDKWFSDSAQQTLYLHATHWASDNLEVVLIYEPIGEKL